MRPLRKAATWLLVSLLLASFSGSQVIRTGQSLVTGEISIPRTIWASVNLVAFVLAGAVALRVLHHIARAGRTAEQGRPQHE